MIGKLIREYPQFEKYYKEIYKLCRNIERVMQMFSEELRELDRNTVQYMIDDMKDEIDAQRQELKEQKELLGEKDNEIGAQRKLLSKKDNKIVAQKGMIDTQKKTIDAQNKEIEELKRQLAQLHAEIP